MHSYEKKKCYNVLIDSANGTTTGIRGVARQTYNFDFNLLPDVPMKMTYEFVCNAIDFIDGQKQALLSVGLGQSSNFQVGTGTGARTTQVIGQLYTEEVGEDNSGGHTYMGLKAKRSDVVATYFYGRPQIGSNFEVKIEDELGNEFIGDTVSDTIDNYILILHFEEV